MAVVGGVGGAGFVGVGAEGVGALDLDAEEVNLGLGTVVEDEVVALAVSPGLGDGEAALAGLVEECSFGALAGALGVGTAGVALRHVRLREDLVVRRFISNSYYNKGVKGLRSKAFNTGKRESLVRVG